jgi:hypothetical protein
MTPEERKQIRLWIEEEAQALKAEDTDEDTTWRDHEASFLLWKGRLMDRLAEKHKDVIWDNLEVEELIENWWWQTATPDELRQFAAYCRKLADQPSAADTGPLIKHAEFLEQLAKRRPDPMLGDN